MPMTVLVTLTTAGIDSGPFNLYSDVDGYVSAFATGIGRATLLVGYSSSVVPTGTTVIRVVSAGNCTNYIDLSVVGTTTTTTTGLTTTTTTGLTTSTTTAIPYNLSVSVPICRLNNCNDNAVCAVRYQIDVDNAPVGSYFTVTQNSGDAVVTIYNSSPVSGVLQFSEASETETANFTIHLRDSGGTSLTSMTMSMSHQAFWQFLDVCPFYISAIKLTSSPTATCLDSNTDASSNYAYVVYNDTWFTSQGGFNVVNGDFALTDSLLYDPSNPSVTIHPNSVYSGLATLLPSGVTGTFMITQDSSETPFKILLISDGDYVTTSPCP